MSRIHIRTMVLCLALAAAVFAAYSNHFQNQFHFDDSHTIVSNVYITKLSNIPQFFTNAAFFSMQPEGRTWRPIVSASLAIDYWLGRGLKPFYFHLSTFVWFLVQLVLMFFLFRRIMDAAEPHPANFWTALFATACFGLHPAMAETVNYVIQRGDLYNTLGVVASLLLFVAYPARRKSGLYLLPAVAAYLAKAPALIFPLILLAYVYLFEFGAGDPEASSRPGRLSAGLLALRATWLAFAVTAAAAILTAKMTASTYNPGAISASLYRITQPWVALHYFKSFFLPTELSADSDWTYVQPFSPQALAGYLFVAVLLAVAHYTSRKREWRPISFGILWFFLAILPTAMLPLADVTNDHRMFFPFVGLVLAVFWALRLALLRKPAWTRAAIAALVVVLALEAAATHQRNQVWRSEESLWRDVAEKSPRNGRGLMNYAAALLIRGDFTNGLPLLQRAAALNPLDFLPEMNLGVAYGGMKRDAEADQHFQRSIVLAPAFWEPHYYYGHWLESKGRLAEAQAELESAVQYNLLSFAARSLLMQVYEETGNNAALETLAQETLKLAGEDETARHFGMPTGQHPEQPVPPVQPAPPQSTTLTPAVAQAAAEDILRDATKDCRAEHYDDCLAKTRRVLELRPEYPEAYNVLAMAFIATGRGDDGIEALQHALRINPDYETAKKNLAWALEERKKVLAPTAKK